MAQTAHPSTRQMLLEQQLAQCLCLHRRLQLLPACLQTGTTPIVAGRFYCDVSWWQVGGREDGDAALFGVEQWRVRALFLPAPPSLTATHPNRHSPCPPLTLSANHVNPSLTAWRQLHHHRQPLQHPHGRPPNYLQILGGLVFGWVGWWVFGGMCRWVGGGYTPPAVARSRPEPFN